MNIKLNTSPRIAFEKPRNASDHEMMGKSWWHNKTQGFVFARCPIRAVDFGEGFKKRIKLFVQS